MCPCELLARHTCPRQVTASEGSTGLGTRPTHPRGPSSLSARLSRTNILRDSAAGLAGALGTDIDGAVGASEGPDSHPCLPHPTGTCANRGADRPRRVSETHVPSGASPGRKCCSGFVWRRSSQRVLPEPTREGRARTEGWAGAHGRGTLPGLGQGDISWGLGRESQPPRPSRGLRLHGPFLPSWGTDEAGGGARL